LESLIGTENDILRWLLREWTGRTFRDCRIPTMSKIEAEFGDASAKLIWPAGIDRKKMESKKEGTLGNPAFVGGKT
jgi:hypothetical protein